MNREKNSKRGRSSFLINEKAVRRMIATFCRWTTIDALEALDKAVREIVLCACSMERGKRIHGDNLAFNLRSGVTQEATVDPCKTDCKSIFQKSGKSESGSK